MSRESGITTMSLIIYIIAMMVVIGIIATITSFFYTNVNLLSDNSDNISEITKFHMYFLSETTKRDNAILDINDSYITFASGNTFTFQDNSIYLNHIRICEDIYNVQFDTDTVNSKTVVKVLMTIGNYNEYTRTTEYVLNIN
jgi:hypothetical protein